MEGRIAELEAELALLKSEAGELRLRRSAAAQHHRARVEAIRSGKQASGASPEQIAAALQPALGALEGLAVAVSGGSGGGGAAVPADAAALSGEVVAAEVPVKLLGAMQQVVELSLGQLTELGGKARFYRERLDKVGWAGTSSAWRMLRTLPAACCSRGLRPSLVVASEHALSCCPAAGSVVLRCWPRRHASRHVCHLF